ncbi:MAG: bifunctional hydroxymethylpyrimidine kinase/phosphomethylpyrimidine kinase [Hyphomicrobiaceae bacterium]
MTTTSRPIAMTIAGSDPSGGAGIQADLKTFSALGVYGASIITALTAQNTMGVTGVMKVPAAFIRAQYEAVVSDLDVAAAKTGMLGDEETVLTVAELVERSGLKPLVVDPVMVATSGDVLLEPAAIDAVRKVLIPLAAVITPNLDEAARLLECPVAESEAEARRQAAALLKLGCRSVFLKGGHGSGAEAVDYLATANNVTVFSHPRIETKNTHGTGCTLAAALTARLAAGVGLVKAAEQAKQYLWDALNSGAHMNIGRGHGPVDHLFARVPKEE